jgi:N-acetylneuraminic acid mutarotase
MNFKNLIVSLLFLFGNSFGQSWNKLQDFPGVARDDGSTFTIGNKVYGGTGLQVGWTCANDFYVFDLTTETWGVIAPLPLIASRQYAVGFSILGKGYVFGGVNDSGSLLNDLWEYNPTTDTWLQKLAMPSIGRSGSVAFVINDVVYIVGGKTSTNNAIPETWMYNPITNSWTQLANLPINGIWRGVSFTNNSKGFVGLGKNNLDHYHKLFYEYAPTTNTWSQVLGYSHSGRAYTGYAQIGNFGYLFGGADSLGFIDNSFEKIDLSNFSTFLLNSFTSIPRKGCMAFVGNSSFYITTGVSTAARFNETWKASNVVSINDFEKDETVSVFPNPASNNFTITLKNTKLKSVKMYNFLGQEVLFVESNYSEMNISTSFEVGVYSLYICTENNKILIRKLIIN